MQPNPTNSTFQQNVNQGYQPGTSSPLPQFQGGVQPITQVPLHRFERDALSQMGVIDSGGLLEQGRSAISAFAANPQGEAQRFIDPRTGQALGGMADMVQQGTRRMSDADVQRYMNPYQGQVVDAAVRRVSDAGERMRARLTAGQGQRGARSFGDSAFGMAVSNLNDDLLEQTGDTSANLLYSGFNDAVGNFNTEQDRFLQGAQLEGQRAGMAQDIFSSGLGMAANTADRLFNSADKYRAGRADALKTRLGAGSYIREFNQGQADQLESEILRRMGMKEDRLQGLGNSLNLFTDGGTDSRTSRPEDTNNLTKFGGAAKFLGDNWGEIRKEFA
jgi:hypothetical protein